MSAGNSFPQSSFAEHLRAEVNRCHSENYGEENWDKMRFGEYAPGGPVDRGSSFSEIEFIRQHADRFSRVYDSLADSQSREILIKVLAYRMLGWRKVRLPLADERPKEIEFAEAMVIPGQALKISFRAWTLRRFNLTRAGLPFDCFTRFPRKAMLEQYDYPDSNPPIMCMGNDWVIDGGGGWGDTALRFAYLSAPDGRVFSFEFAEENLEVFRENIGINPNLSERISIVQKALWHVSGNELSYDPAGPGTKAKAASAGHEKVYTVSIDDFARENHLPRVSFIKLDIEGSELNALQGAERVLRQYRPKLAVSLYHQIQDFVRIPDYLLKLSLGYRFFLKHCTMHHEETVLLADCPA